MLLLSIRGRSCRRTICLETDSGEPAERVNTINLPETGSRIDCRMIVKVDSGLQRKEDKMRKLNFIYKLNSAIIIPESCIAMER